MPMVIMSDPTTMDSTAGSMYTITTNYLFSENTTEASSDRSNISSTADSTNSTTGNDRPDERLLWISPVPEWKTAIPIWGAAWDFHVYFFASLFALLTVYTLVLLYQTMETRRRMVRKRGKGSRNKGGMRSLLPPPVFSLIAFASFLRALCLYADPYHSRGTFPTVVARMFGGLPFTSYVCAYQLLFMALNSALRVEVGSLGWLTKKWLIFSVVLFFMFFNTLVDVILVEAAKLRPLLLVCMVANSCWMAFIAVEFAMNAYRLKQRINESKAAFRPGKRNSIATAMASSGVTAAMAASPKQVKGGSRIGRGSGIRESMRKLTRRLTNSSPFPSRSEREQRTQQLQEHILLMTYVLLATLLAYLTFMLYYLLGVAGAISFDGLVKPWRWYTLSTCYRILELLLSVAIIYMLIKSQKKKRDVPDGLYTSSAMSMTGPVNLDAVPPSPSPVQLAQDIGIEMTPSHVSPDAAYALGNDTLPAAVLAFQRRSLFISTSL